MQKQEAIWTTAKGQQIRVCDMTASHLVNAIKMIERNGRSKGKLYWAMKNDYKRRQQDKPKPKFNTECIKKYDQAKEIQAATEAAVERIKEKQLTTLGPVDRWDNKAVRHVTGLSGVTVGPDTIQPNQFLVQGTNIAEWKDPIANMNDEQLKDFKKRLGTLEGKSDRVGYRDDLDPKSERRDRPVPSRPWRLIKFIGFSILGSSIGAAGVYAIDHFFNLGLYS